MDAEFCQYFSWNFKFCLSGCLTADMFGQQSDPRSTIGPQSYVGSTHSTWPRGSAGIGLASDHQKALGGQQHHQILLQYSATAVALLQPSLWYRAARPLEPAPIRSAVLGAASTSVNPSDVPGRKGNSGYIEQDCSGALFGSFLKNRTKHSNNAALKGKCFSSGQQLNRSVKIPLTGGITTDKVPLSSPNLLLWTTS